MTYDEARVVNKAGQSVPLVERDVVKLSSGRITGVDLQADWPVLGQVRQVVGAALELEQRFHREVLADDALAPRIVGAEGARSWAEVAPLAGAAVNAGASVME